MLNNIWGKEADYSHAGERGHAMQQGITYDVRAKLMTQALFDLPSYKHAQAVNIKPGSEASCSSCPRLWYA